MTDAQTSDPYESYVAPSAPSGRVGIQAAAESVKAQANSATVPVKNKGGRPRKDALLAQKASEIDATRLSREQAEKFSNMLLNNIVEPPLLSLALSHDSEAKLAGYANFTFALSPKEKEDLKTALVECLDGLSLVWLAKLMPWGALIMTSVNIAWSRVEVAKAISVKNGNNATTNKPNLNNGDKGERKIISGESSH